MSEALELTTPCSDNNCSEILSDTGEPPLVLCHVYMMIISWMILVPTAICSAWNMRPILTSKKKYLFIAQSKTEFWYDIHFYCNSASGILTITGIICIFAYAKEWAGSLDWMNNHCYYGMTVILLLSINIMLGFARPSGGDDRRKNFNVLHGVCGLLCLIFSWMTIEQGLSFWSYDADRTYQRFGIGTDQIKKNTYIVFWLFISIMIVGFLSIEVLKSRYLLKAQSTIRYSLIKAIFYFMTLSSFVCGLVLMVYLY